MDKLLYGVAYYDEYMPYDRLQEDIKMMKDANINVVRIAESTWSTLEPQDGVFDFYHIDRVLDAMEEANISVIIGTPTYAFPTWLAKKYPEILAETKDGKERYGRRQNMDITNKDFLFHAERVIRKLMERVSQRKCVIGFQLDNETKHYDNAGENVQKAFIEYLKEKFSDIKELNEEFGLTYWSNRINNWDDFPDVLGTINGSLGSEFSKFQRTLVNKFLAWQSDIVKEYKREDQFITHNFDFEWIGYSYGVQSRVNHFEASKCLTIAGVDIYHPSQDDLTGIEVSFGGDMTRSLKQDNYLVLETQAQGFPQWVPYKGQLRLLAFSHIASGANSVMYWHWHSIHNSFETYWKGLLSHDLKSNATYEEAKIVGAEFKKLSDKVVNLKKKNDVAVLVSNEALTSLEWFKISDSVNYNTVVRWMYDELYKLNVGCDFINPDTLNLENYKIIVVPALYSVPDSTLIRLKEYVKNGGRIVVSFKSAVANEHVKVSYNDQPNIISECCGVTYNQFTVPKNTFISGFDNLKNKDLEIKEWMELLKPTTAKIISKYEHRNWGNYAAITENNFGEGKAVYIGCFTSENVLREIYINLLKETSLYTEAQKFEFPIIIKNGYNKNNKKITFYFNYSGEAKTIKYINKSGYDLLLESEINNEKELNLEPWGLTIVEE